MVGKKVSRYVIERKLADGPLGPVWLATDGMLGRQVWLRTLSESLASSPEIRYRFVREARLASVLTHPRIALIYDAGEDGDIVFTASEYVDGESIEAILSKDSLPEDQAIRIARDVAEALQHAHGKKLIHRDVNPASIMLGKDGSAKLMEFGSAARDDRRTQTVAIAVSTDYIAPEVLAGFPADARSDVYGLGMVLREMVKGGPDSNPQLEAVIREATAEDPGKRIPSAAELAQKLARLLPEARSTVTLPQTLVGSASRFGGRHRWPGWKPVLGAVMVLGFVGIYVTREPIRKWITGDSEQKRARALELYEEGRVAWGEEQESARRALDLFRQAVELDPKLAEAQVGVGSAILANLYYGWSGISELSEAKQSFRNAIEIAPQFIPAWRGLIRASAWDESMDSLLKLAHEIWQTGNRDYQTMMAMADAFWTGGLPEYSLPFLHEARRLDPDSKETQYHLVYRTVHTNRLREGIDEGLLYSEKFGPDPEVDPWIAMAYRGLGDLDSARVYFDRGLEHTEATTSNHYIYLLAGRCYLELGLEEEAKTILRQGASIMEQRLEFVGDNTYLMGLLLQSYLLLGEKEKALERYSGLRDDLKGRIVLPSLSGKKAHADFLAAEFRQGAIDNNSYSFKTHPEAEDLWTDPEYSEALAEYKRLITRLHETYGHIDLINEYRANGFFEPR